MRLDIGLLFLRVTAGGMMLLGHGLTKLMNFTAYSAAFPDPLGMGVKFSLVMAIFAELFCSFLVVIGLSTRLAAIPVVGTMLVAGVIVHAPDAWQKKELAFLFLAAFGTLIFTGPGAFSLDGVIRMRRSSRP